MDWSATERGGMGFVEISLKGDFDLYAAPAFSTSALAGIEGGWSRVLLDCVHLSYLDSTGVGVIIRMLQALRRKGGELRCRGLHGTPRRVLEMSNILPLLPEEKA